MQYDLCDTLDGRKARDTALASRLIHNPPHSNNIPSFTTTTLVCTVAYL
jgi:hypothetical protein